MTDFTAIDPDVLDEQVAYGPEPQPDDDKEARLARAFSQGVNLKLDAPPIEGAQGDTGTDELIAEQPRRRGRRPGSKNKPRSGSSLGGAQIGQLFVAGFVVLIGFTIGDWANPTEEEADAIAKPLGNILARRIDLASKLGKDADDVVMLAIAIMSYTARIGPIAAGKARNAWTERQNAPRVDRPPRPIDATDNRGTGSVAVRDHGFQGAQDGTTRSPFDAVSAVAENGLAYLDRNLKPATQ